MLGSCVFNLGILVVVDFLHREVPLYTRASHGHILSAAFGVVMIAIVGLFLLLARENATPSIGRIGAYTPVIVALYLLAMRMVYAYERREVAEFVEVAGSRYAGITLSRALTGYGTAAAVVVASGTWLPFVGEAIAVSMGWHESFVGTLFVAAATSAPEIAVTVAALRIGALDMAVANLLGSNLFDILIVAVDDLFYAGGPILAHVTPVHAFSALTAIIMTGAAIVGFFYRPSGRVAGTVSWISVFLLALYAVNAYVLFRYGT
ncbi:MAG: hypothetical protein OHK0026_16630 [Rhodocyclaceae bacterium]